MVNLRMQYRKNYDEKKIANTIYAREMKAHRARIRQQRRVERRKRRKKEKKRAMEEALAGYVNKLELEYCSILANKELVFQMLSDIEDITAERESDCVAYIYKSSYDTFTNKIERLNKQLSKPIVLEGEVLPNCFSPEDIRTILNMCKQFLEDEKELRKTAKFGRFRGPEGCDLYRNTVSRHFETTMRNAINSGNDRLVKDLINCITKNGATNPDNEFDIFDMNVQNFINFTRMYKMYMKHSTRKKKSKKVYVDPEIKAREAAEKARVRRKERRNRKLRAKGIVPPVDETGSIGRQKRLLRRMEQKLLLEKPVTVEVKSTNVYIESEDEEDWGDHEDTTKEFDTSNSTPLWVNPNNFEGEEEYDAGF